MRCIETALRPVKDVVEALIKSNMRCIETNTGITSERERPDKE